MRRVVETLDAGKPAVPSSQAMCAGGFVFTSGHGPRQPGDRGLALESFGAQMRQTLENIRAVLEAAGSGLEHCVQMTVLLRNRELLAEFNGLYVELMPSPYPPRMTMIAELSHPEVLIEMRAIGVVADPAVMGR